MVHKEKRDGEEVRSLVGWWWWWFVGRVLRDGHQSVAGASRRWGLRQTGDPLHSLFNAKKGLLFFIFFFSLSLFLCVKETRELVGMGGETKERKRRNKSNTRV